MNAFRFLDKAQTLAQLAAVENEPAQYADLVATELPEAPSTIDALEKTDAMLASALVHIDATMTRAMRIRLDHALASDTSIAQPTRNVFAQTIVSYTGRIDLLEGRARDVAARGGARDPETVARLVVDAAAATLALREALAVPLLALAGQRATAAVSDVDARARDRHRDERERKRWSAVRRELEAIAANPVRIMTSPFAARLAAHPEQLDEPDPEPERSFADMIELD